jgi:6-pyruvoyltetrahydropterin/6-carboxytetrahydropterin synthase
LTVRFNLAYFEPLRESHARSTQSANLTPETRHLNPSFYVGSTLATRHSPTNAFEVDAAFALKAIGVLSTLALMSRRFSIEVAKDYFNFASAHFLIFANGRREPLHGHNYQVSVAMEGELDRAGVVLDFITFKPLVKGVCDALDHRTLIQTDSSMIQVRKGVREIKILYKKQRLVLPRGDVILLPIANTSTELLAEYIAGQIKRKVRQNFRADIRYMEVAVEEARGQRGIFCNEF